MSKVNQPALPGCEQIPQRFKDVPCENGSGQPLSLCCACDGSGTTCKGEKLLEVNPSTPPQTVYANFTGAERNAYARKGYAIACETCRHCRGAGLVVEGGK